jgi:hypothetical protein
MFEDPATKITFYSSADPAMIYDAPNPAMIPTSVVTAATSGICNVSRSSFWGESRHGLLKFVTPVPTAMTSAYNSNYTSLTPSVVTKYFEPCPNQF